MGYANFCLDRKGAVIMLFWDPGRCPLSFEKPKADGFP